MRMVFLSFCCILCLILCFQNKFEEMFLANLFCRSFVYIHVLFMEKNDYAHFHLSNWPYFSKTYYVCSYECMSFERLPFICIFFHETFTFLTKAIVSCREDLYLMILMFLAYFLVNCVHSFKLWRAHWLFFSFYLMRTICNLVSNMTKRTVSFFVFFLQYLIS